MIVFRLKIQIPLIYIFYQDYAYAKRILLYKIKLQFINLSIKKINKIKKNRKGNKEEERTLKIKRLQITNLSSDRIKEKCKFYQEYHQDMNLNLEL